MSGLNVDGRVSFPDYAAQAVRAIAEREPDLVARFIGEHQAPSAQASADASANPINQEPLSVDDAARLYIEAVERDRAARPPVPYYSEEGR